MVEVLGVGDAGMDVYLDVDRLPGRDEKVIAQRVEYHPGGMVGNFVVALQRLGTPCGFHGPVGDDDFGHSIAQDFHSEHVDVQGLVRKAGGRTYFCTVMLDGSGEKALVIAPTDCFFPQPSDVREDLFAGVRHVHTTASVLATAERVVEVARSAGCRVSLDLEPTALRQPSVAALLPRVDILFLNQRAVSIVGAATPMEAVERLCALGAGTVCITLGSEGAIAGCGAGALGERAFVPAFDAPVVDTTGAGDSFAAAFVHGSLRGLVLEERLRFASAAAAISIGRRGGHAGSPTQAAVYDFLAGAGSGH